MKKLFSLILVLSLFAVSIPLNAFAIKSGVGVMSGATLSDQTPTRHSLTPPITADARATDFLYGDQLSKNARAVYDELIDLSPNATTLDIHLPETLYFDTFGTPTYWDELEMQEELYYIIQSALDAALMDNAMIFWIKLGENGTNYEWFYYYDTIGTTIDDITLYIVTDERYGPNATSYVNKVKSVVNNFTVSNTSSRYSILKEMHDFLVNKITYDLSAPYAHEPYGALVTGEAVCEGYAEALMLLCDKYSIPCIGVLGNGNNGSSIEAHKWNLVKMEDGKWYGIDVTWDDPIFGNVIYDYFLVGTNTYDAGIGLTFSQSHIQNGEFSIDAPFVFSYPSVSRDKYEYVVPDAKDIKVDFITASSIYLDIHAGEEYSIDGINWTSLGYFRNLAKHTEYTVYARVASDGIMPAGDVKTARFMIVGANEPILLKIVGNFTYGILPDTLISDLGVSYYSSFTGVNTAKNMDFFVKNGQVYNIVISGDINGDGKINSTDFMQVRKAYLNLFQLSGLKELSADVNFDGKINSTDFMQIRRHYLGLYDIFDY